MKQAILLGLLAAISLGVTGCAQKDENGHATAASFTPTGLFNHSGSDVVVGSH